MATEASDRVESVRRNVQEWRDRTVTTLAARTLFYVGLAITGLGLVVVVLSALISRR